MQTLLRHQADEIVDKIQEAIDEVMHCASTGEKTEWQGKMLVSIIEELTAIQMRVDIYLCNTECEKCKRPYFACEKHYN